MSLKVFYSWQSDLPNKTNRGLIKDCLERAIKTINLKEQFVVDFVLDRDTVNVSGTPNIVDTIFDKIDNSYIFIGDVSIINQNKINRKTPNPNVLIELGYAAKVLGWGKIICVYNSDYGKPEDLPFDIKFRRPLIYSTKIEKYKENLTKSFEKAIKEIIVSNPIKNPVNDSIKVQIDTEILSTINHLHKIIRQNEEPFSFQLVSKILDIKKKELEAKLLNKEVLGFRIFKNWNETEKNINNFLNQPLTKYSLSEKTLRIIASIIWKIKDVENHLSNFSFYTKLADQSLWHKVVSGKNWNRENQKLPDRLILLKHLKDDKFVVEDFGDFIPNLDKDLLSSIFSLRVEATPVIAEVIIDLFEEINKWLDHTNNEFIVDEKMFRLYPKNLR